MSNIFKTGIQIPKVVKKLELSNYHKELKGKYIMVWVNLTRAAHNEYADIQEQLRLWSIEGKHIIGYIEEKVKEAQETGKTDKQVEKIREKTSKDFDVHMESVATINDLMYSWYAEVWSQHKDEIHHCTADEVRKIAETSNEQDNSSFWGWMTQRTQSMIVLHGNQQLKK